MWHIRTLCFPTKSIFNKHLTYCILLCELSKSFVYSVVFQANLGRMDTKTEKMKQVVGNLALIQAQAAVVGFLASVFAIILGWIPKGEFRMDHALLLCASSLATASLASLVLGKFNYLTWGLFHQRE